MARDGASNIAMPPNTNRAGARRPLRGLPSLGLTDLEMRANRVELQVPARPDMLFMTRMTAAAVASCTGIGYDRVEDLRLALDELCLTLMEQHPSPERLDVEFTWEDHSILVSARVKGTETSYAGARPRPATTLNGFSRRILDSIVDGHGVESIDGSAHSWFRMSGCQGRRDD